MRLSFLILLLLSSVAVRAQMASPPHANAETGVIEGTLKPLHVGHTVVLMVFQNGQRVLMLDKETDAQGKFSFKNIFADPSYAYAVGAMVGNQVYVMPDLKLKPGEKKITVEFPIGPGSPYLMPAESASPAPGDQAMAPQASDAKTPFSTKWGTPYQKVAVLLSLFVLFLALRFYRAKKSS
ncbi:MAG: hypothetical protein Q7T11_02835 [Deltaproteobacteria bacterium]|nr:hypothetical protein [Deltaproteobacteria bacterium]